MKTFLSYHLLTDTTYMAIHDGSRFKLSGSLLKQTNDDDDEDDDDDDDVEKMYETDSNFYSSVSGKKKIRTRD